MVRAMVTKDTSEGGDARVLDRLAETIDARASAADPESSYVARLLAGGLDAIAAKVREEAEELIEASAAGDPQHVAHEAADLLFHAFVLLRHADVAPERVYAELARRAGVSGLVEKAQRAEPGGADAGR